MSRLFRSLLLLTAASALALAGCDSGVPPTEAGQDSATTLQFGTSSITVTEQDGSLRVPVVLQNPDGQSVTAEVLLALGASSADATDLGLDNLNDDNFRGGGNAYVVRQVEFSGEAADDTAYVEFNVTDENDTEDREVAVLALQNLQSSGAAALGDPQELELSIGFPPLVDVRSGAELGDDATVTGTVTRIDGGDTIYLQDETAGFVVFSSTVGSAVSPGDRIVATGDLEAFAGLLQLTGAGDSDFSEGDFSVISEDNPLPEPQTVTLSEIASDGEQYEAELLRIEGLTFSDAGGTFSGGTNYNVSDGTGGAVPLRIPSGSPYVGQPIPSGEVTFTGVLGQFHGFDFVIEPDTGYQLLALREGDIQP